MGFSLLAIDVGNSNTVLGLFEGKKLKKWRILSRQKALAQWARKYQGRVDGIIISNVVPALKQALKNLSQKLGHPHPLFVTSRLKMPVRLKVKNPRSIGADRIVNAVAAYSLYRKKTNLVIIDLGTATTLDLVTSKGEFLGGVITPGIKTMSDALAEKCAQLPKVRIQCPRSPLGRNTREAIQSGIFFGYVGLIKGLIQKISKEHHSSLAILITGGLAPLIRKALKSIKYKIQTEPDLTLMGLQILYEKNEPIHFNF